MAILLAAGWFSAAWFGAPLHARQEPSTEVPDAWRGGAGLVVSVVNDEGTPLPDVRVAVRLGESPEWLTTTTEDDGRARFEGLADGEWEVDVRREGFMLFNAFVALEAGRKPKVAFSSRQRTGTYWEPLQAVFLPPDVKLTRGMASGRQSVDQALAEQRRREKREEADERRARRAARRGELARVEETGPVQEPVIRDLVEPVPVVETKAEAEPEPGAVSEPSAPPVSRPPAAGPGSVEQPPAGDSSAGSVEAGPEASPAPAAAAPRGAAPTVPSVDRNEPTVATAIETPSEPSGPEPPGPPGTRVEEPAPAPRSARFAPREPPRRLLANPNLRPAGACPECAPGEFSVASRGQAERWQRGDVCNDDSVAAMQQLVVDLVGALDDERRAYAGSLRESNGNDVLRLLPDSLRDEISAALETSADSCTAIGAVLPAGARYVGFRYQVGERSIMAECPDIQPDGSQVCQLEEARWLGPPRIIEQDGVQVVLAVFENRSRRSTRLPQLVVYFEPARGWLPPSN